MNEWVGRSPRRVRSHPRHSPRVQAKLKVGPAGDCYEQEADVVAAQVVRAMRRTTPASWNSDQHRGRVRPMTGSEAADAGPDSIVSRIQRMGTIGTAGGDVDAETEQAITSSTGRGRPLPADVRARVEPAFGADFGNVRVHDGARATELNDRIQAKAFTTGSDIFFRDGLPDMSTRQGQHLLAHELTHTIQQGAVGSAAQRTTAVQRFLDPSQQLALARAEGQLKALLQTPKGKGKGAKNRRDKIQALRDKIDELEAIDRATPKPELASSASLTTPSVQNGPPQESTPKSDPKAAIAAAVLTPSIPEPTTSEPKSGGPKAGGTKSVGTTTGGPKAGGKTAAPVQQQSPPETVAEPVVEPVVKKGPDLATESLRATQAELDEHRLKTPGRRAKAKHDKKTSELEAKVAELEAAILEQHPLMSAAIGKAAAQDITNAFQPAAIAELGKVVPAREMEGLCATLGADKLRTLADAYGIPEMWLRIRSWTTAVVKDLLSEYSAAELVKLEKAIGVARFRMLLTVRRVPASAFKHYTTTFMKTFPGATETTWQHLINIGYNNAGAISGGHDQATFYAFAAQEGVDIDNRQSIGSNEKVTYTTYWSDGSVAQTGSKTLIPGLIGKKAAMMAAVNDALWNSIAKKEFDVTSSAWQATTRDRSKTFSGFYRNGAIDTFFPVG